MGFRQVPTSRSTVGAWTYDIVADKLIADPVVASFFSVSDADARMGLPIGVYFDRLHIADRLRIMRIWTSALARGAAYSATFRVMTREGLYRWIEARGNFFGETDGQSTGFVGLTEELVMDSQTPIDLLTNQLIDAWKTAELVDDDVLTSLIRMTLMEIGLATARDLTASGDI